ncbi:MAG: hypothetical protein HC772_16365 [Leptolyngbyaceae cyanobacterium CRU_2_3]|nr:hypothetical protein [Leptolyngbyaceae cyanobacterium CRU_2_3]
MLAHPIHDPSDAMPLHDRVQIALAIADPLLLKSLLTDCTPPIAPPHQIGSISTKIGVPVESRRAIDGIIQFESIYCVIAESQEDAEQGVLEYAQRHANSRGYLDLTRCEAEISTLGQSLSLAQAIALLAQSGFSPQQVDAILHLPQDAWYKSWWFMRNTEGGFTVPFLRSIRTRRYINGTFTIQYKDFFAQDKPPCFQSQSNRVLVEIGTEPKNFRKTLEKINYARQQFGMAQALLICEQISDLEVQGFISQGISIYATHEITLPARARCMDCATAGCPMHGRADSPVTLCQRFCLETHPV